MFVWIFQTPQRLSGVLLILLVAACGGGGGGSGGSEPDRPTSPEPTEQPHSTEFGLEARASLVPPAFPLRASGAEVPVHIVPAFPSLDFEAPVIPVAIPGAGNQLAVVEQPGRILALNNATSADTTRTLLNISAQVLYSDEQGLLGLAFDPDYPRNGFFYVYYSADAPRRSVIARFTVDPQTGQAPLESEVRLLEIEQPFANHNGGALAFGPDGLLYIASGDGGSAGDPMNNAQNPDNLLGKILRIDVRGGPPYSVPAANPFAAGGGRGEIFAMGLRNPFRMSFDRQTGDLWAGDVGQANREEVDIVRVGENYGWRVFEGTKAYDDSLNTLPDSAFTPPVYDYGREDGVSIIGGVVYRGAAIPDLVGDYIFGDYGSGQLWRLQSNEGQYRRSGLAQIGAIVGIGEDAAGELLVASLSGSIYRIEADTGAANGVLPATLSEAGLFTDLENMTPVPGLIPYAVNTPFYSDGADKTRWFGIPDGTVIAFEAESAWGLPRASVVVKHFTWPAQGVGAARKLETRVLVNTATGWQGYAYRWRDDQTDADLLSDGAAIALNDPPRDYLIPSRGQCAQCHNAAAGYVLGLRTPQLNRQFDFAARTDNQLRSFEHIGLLDQNLGLADIDHDDNGYPQLPTALGPAATADIHRRARAYLAVNCGYCHRPGGGTGSAMDLRFNTPLSASNTVGETPIAGDLSIDNAVLIAPGDPQRSVLLARMSRRDAAGMPPLSTAVPDADGVALIREWIAALRP